MKIDDETVLAAVSTGATRLSVIMAWLAVPTKDDRKLDRVLQRLRRQGKLTFDSKNGRIIP